MPHILQVLNFKNVGREKKKRTFSKKIQKSIYIRDGGALYARHARLRGYSADSIQRFINKPANKWKHVYEGNRPLLSTKHKTDRKQYCHDRLNEGDKRWDDHFDVDEKWFYGYCLGQKCKVSPGHKRPQKPLHSRRHIPKVMFLAATALPRPDKGFDGKIGFFRVTETVTAKRKSKNHQKGDQYEKDVTMDADKYREMMVRQVFPAARKKMPWAKNLRCQQDGAGVHTGKNNVNKLNKAGKGRKRRGRRSKTANITVFTQPAKSPDTNIKDLAIFPSMSKRFNKKQKHEVVNDLDRLAANAVDTWKNFPTDVLTKAWATKTNIVKAIIKADGRNNFKLPHAKDTEDSEWEEICLE